MKQLEDTVRREQLTYAGSAPHDPVIGASPLLLREQIRLLKQVDILGMPLGQPETSGSWRA